MLEINKKQLLGFDNVNRARILKYIGDDTNENNAKG